MADGGFRDYVDRVNNRNGYFSRAYNHDNCFSANTPHSDDSLNLSDEDTEAMKALVGSDARVEASVVRISDDVYDMAKTIGALEAEVKKLTSDLAAERERLHQIEKEAGEKERKQRRTDIIIAILSLTAAVLAWVIPSPFG